MRSQNTATRATAASGGKRQGFDRAGEPINAQNILPPVIAQGFDYTNLSAETVALAQRTAEKVRGWRRRLVADAIDIGGDLLRVKKALGHGSFSDWLRAEFPGDIRTAQRCMQVASAFADKNDTVSHLPLSTVYLLAAPTTPKTIVAEVITKLENAEPIDQPALRWQIKRARARLVRRRRQSDQAIEEAERQRREQAEAAAQELIEEIGFPIVERVLNAMDDLAVRGRFARSSTKAPPPHDHRPLKATVRSIPLPPPPMRPPHPPPPRVSVTSGLLIRSVKVPAKVGRRQLARRTRLAAADLLGLAPVELEHAVAGERVRGCQLRHNPSNRVAKVVVATGRVIDAVAPATRGAAFEADDLRNKSRIVEQLELPGVNGREHIAIEIGFRLGGGSYVMPCSRKRSRGHSPP